MSETNGGRNLLKIVGGVSGVLVVVNLFFVAGIQFNKITSHVADTEVHPTTEERRRLIAEIVEEHLDARIGSIEVQLRTLTQEVERLREKKYP